MHKPKILKIDEVESFLEKTEVFHKELTKLRDIFKDVDPVKAQLVEGLIEEAAFLRAESYNIRNRLSDTGMVEFNPNNPKIQRTSEAAKQLLKINNSYNTTIRTLNGILSKNELDLDDGLDEFE